MNRASNAGHSIPMPTALKKQAADVCASLRARLDACTPEQARALLFGLFWLSIVGFSFGQAFVVAGPLLCLPPLAFLYWKDWSNTTWSSLAVAQSAGLCPLPAPGLGPALASLP